MFTNLSFTPSFSLCRHDLEMYQDPPLRRREYGTVRLCSDMLVTNTERIRRRYGRSSDADVSLLDIWRRATSDDMSVAAITGGYYETDYYVNVSIGTPLQHFRMVIDTGFPDTWVAAPCNAFDCPTGIALYNSSKSDSGEQNYVCWAGIPAA
ncbi:hypothetical protein C8R44DRAFT_329376 [Mycena epipterygia]|nr:hypothetical protein C8R44DRAFT_329376 [Mycena epipterygia]